MRNKILATALFLTVAGLVVFTKPKNTEQTTETTKYETTTPVKGPTLSALVPAANVTNLRIKPEQLVLLLGDINDMSAELIISKLTAASKNSKEVYLLIDSGGGSVFAGNKIIAFMQAIPTKIHTVCYGICASMAAQVFEMGSTRIMMPSAILMFHQASAGVQGTLGQMNSMLGLLNKVIEKSEQQISKRSGIPVEKWKDMISNELWLTSDEAVQMNLADQLSVAFTTDFLQQLQNSIVPEQRKSFRSLDNFR